MNINIPAILIATALQFIIGAIWYMSLFGKLWGKMHNFDKYTPEEQAKMQKGMWPLLIVQFVVTLITTFVFALLLNGFPVEWNIYGLAGFFWLGFVVPTQISTIIFGGTDPQWVIKKILISAGGSLLCLEAAAFVLKMMN